jgi:hypothetical protein
MQNEFESLYSIELSEELAEKAQKRFKASSRISILQGDSGVKVAEILPQLQAPVLFWLDGHYSGECFVGLDVVKTAKGVSNTPILKELGAILNNGIGRNVILIDDARCFDGTNGYPSYDGLVRFAEQFNIKPQQITKQRDIIRIVPNL